MPYRDVVRTPSPTADVRRWAKIFPSTKSGQPIMHRHAAAPVMNGTRFMLWMLVKTLISAAIIVTVSELSSRFPRTGALLLTLPIVSILAFGMSWQEHHNLPAISRLARETLILVPLGLPFFVPLAFAERLGLGFWTASGLGLVFASTTIGLWFALGPKSL